MNRMRMRNMNTNIKTLISIDCKISWINMIGNRFIIFIKVWVRLVEIKIIYNSFSQWWVRLSMILICNNHKCINQVVIICNNLDSQLWNSKLIMKVDRVRWLNPIMNRNTNKYN